MFLYVSKQIFSKLYLQVNHSRILRIRVYNFWGIFYMNTNMLREICKSEIVYFQPLKVIEKNLWRSYISILGIYNDSKWSRLELSYFALKNLEILTKVLEINFMAGGSQMKCDVMYGFWQKSLQSVVVCYLLSSDVYITFNK